MPTPNGEQFTNLHLFDPSQYDEEKTPGQMNMDEWLETQEPVFHGTFRSDFSEAPTAHYGTMGPAVKNLWRVGSLISNSQLNALRYYDPSAYEIPDEYPNQDEDHIGRVFARRLSRKPPQITYADSDANSGDVAYRVNVAGEIIDEVPRSVISSAFAFDLDEDDGGVNLTSSRAALAAGDLESKRPIVYSNTSEMHPKVDMAYPYKPNITAHGFADTDYMSAFSVVAPKESVSSWERDVLDDPKSSIFAKQFAQQRIDQGKEGAVPFPHPDNPFEDIPRHAQTRLTIRSDGTLGKGPDETVPEFSPDQDKRLNLVDKYRVPGASA